MDDFKQNHVFSDPAILEAFKRHNITPNSDRYPIIIEGYIAGYDEVGKRLEKAPDIFITNDKVGVIRWHAGQCIIRYSMNADLRGVAIQEKIIPQIIMNQMPGKALSDFISFPGSDKYTIQSCFINEDKSGRKIETYIDLIARS